MIITQSTLPKTTGFSISTSSSIENVIPTVTDGGVGEDASYITNPDHSLTYSSGTSVSDFSMDFGQVFDITYVGISGHNAATPSQATIQLYDGDTLIDFVTLTRNNNVMFTFSQMTFTNLILKFVTVPNNYETTVSWIAAGKHITFPKGEQSGYKRAWLMRSMRTKTVTSNSSAPVSTTKRRKTMKQSLSFPNQELEVSHDTWQTFLDFAEASPFFMNENNSLPEATHLGYDAIDTLSAHSSTRCVDNVKLSYTAFNGL